jgi:thymidylate synthase
MRIYKDCLEMIKEVDRDLLVQGITVPISHYQNKKLQGEDRFTKELIGVSFMISKPLEQRKEMIEFIFKGDADKIEKYCIQEHEDRVSGTPLNPGNSYKIRQDMWQKFMVGDEYKMFDYTYSERLWWQFYNVIKTLKEDKHSRQAVLQVFQAKLDNTKFGGDTRIPCSVDYQILIRNDRVYVIYHMRSSDYFGHFPIDIWLSSELLKWFCEQLKPTYPELKTGSLTYFAGSLHAYKWDLDKVIIF